MPDQTPAVVEAETPADANGHQWQQAEPGGYDSCRRCGVFRFAYYARAERRPCPVPTVAPVVATLRYDEATVVAMLAALKTCPPALRMDSLVVVTKTFVESKEWFDA